MTGLWMAKEIGAFERQGIQADLLFISSGPVVVSALLGGDLHAGVAATNAVIGAVLGGAALTATVSTANRPADMSLWVQPEIKRPEDLRGKTLGVTRFGGVTDNLTRLMLRKYGLEGAVQVRQMGGTIESGGRFPAASYCRCGNFGRACGCPCSGPSAYEHGGTRHSLFDEPDRVLP